MHVTFPPIIIVLGTKDLDGSRLMPERAGHNTTKVKINWTELITFIRGGMGSPPMLRGPNKLAGPRSSMRHPPELCWAKMGSRVLGRRLKPARCRAPMIWLPLGTGRGPKHTAGSGGSTCTRSVLTPAVQVWGLPGPWDPGGLETWAVSFSSELCTTLQPLCLPSWREALHDKRAELGSGVLDHQLAYFSMGTLAASIWGDTPCLPAQAGLTVV